MSDPIFADVDRYLGDLFGPDDPVLQDALARAEREGLPAISISSTLGRFLHVVALATGARRILEVGTLGGYSTIWLARALPADGQLISLEFSPHHAEVARTNLEQAGLATQVEVKVGAAVETLRTMVDAGVEPFDLVFIDADKESYPQYLDYAVQLSRRGTLVVADNVVRRGAVVNQTDDAAVSGIQQFNQTLANDPRLTTSILQTISGVSHDGVALAVVTDPDAAG